jgi:hypothetical protein
MQVSFDKEIGNHRQQRQQVYSEIISGSLAGFRQKQVCERVKSSGFSCKINVACCASSEINILSGNMKF